MFSFKSKLRSKFTRNVNVSSTSLLRGTSHSEHGLFRRTIDSLDVTSHISPQHTLWMISFTRSCLCHDWTTTQIFPFALSSSLTHSRRIPHSINDTIYPYQSSSSTSPSAQSPSLFFLSPSSGSCHQKSITYAFSYLGSGFSVFRPE